MKKLLLLFFGFTLVIGCGPKPEQEKATTKKETEQPATGQLETTQKALTQPAPLAHEEPAKPPSGAKQNPAVEQENPGIKNKRTAASDTLQLAPGFPETVLVGNPGNAADHTGFGAISYTYRIGKFELTNAEYCRFLNTKAQEDPNQLYDYRMAESHGGITRSGSFGNYSYQTKQNAAGKPVSYLTWASCARFANWLSNGRGNSDTERGSYILSGGLSPEITLPDHAALASAKLLKWVIASEDEWYKAAYYDPEKPGGAGYWRFAASGGSAPPCNINSNQISVAGAFKAASPYGTYDQNGNLWEYNETRNGDKVGLRGGSFFIDDHEGYLQSHVRYEVLSAKWPNYGFRIVALGETVQSNASATPKPKDLPPNPIPAKESAQTQPEKNAPEIIVTSPPSGRTKPTTYYVSSSGGNDKWNGQSSLVEGESGPWKTLARASVQYLPGDVILLKRGDVWHDELSPKGNGTAEKPITISSYGEGAKPVIDRQDYNQDRTGIRLSDQGGYKIMGIEFSRCMTGIYADYPDNGTAREYLWIEDCYFHDSLKYQHYEDYPKRKIGLGVCLFSHERDNRIVLSNIMVKDCVFRRLASGFWTNSPDNFNKNASYIYNFKNLIFDHCLFEEGYQWQQGIRGVDTGVMRNCITHDIGRNFRSFNGVAGSMFFRCKNWLFEDCEWGFVSIGLGSGDGQAFDFEGNCDDMIMRNCLFHDTDGPGFLLCCYASDGHAHSGIVMENCVINGKSKRPIGLPRCAIINTTDWNESTWRKCRFYLSPGESVMRVMDPEKDKKTTFIDCRVKDLAAACRTKKLAGRITRSGKNADSMWIEINFGKSAIVNEFLIKEEKASSITRYVIELWDTKNDEWMSCFNGRSIGKDFAAPIVQRETTKARLRVIQTQNNQAKITEFSAFKDSHGEPWNVKRGDNTPNRVGKTREQLTSLLKIKALGSKKDKRTVPVKRNLVWDTKVLFEKPLLHDTSERPARGMRSFFYEGADYKGKPTWVFAYYATPKGKAPEGGWPAVVCAHGGGGTAYPEWVKYWNNKGYTALAMDLEGHLPGGNSHHLEGNHPTNVNHRNAGPSRIDWFGDRAKPDKEKWFYHAVADVIRANSLLRTFPEVNPGKIGLNGISWGGTVVSAAAGIDSRLAFAIPVYGGGFIHESDNEGLAQWFPPKTMTEQQFHDYKTKWDPSAHLPHAGMPMLWVTSVADPVFQIDIVAKSARTAGGESLLCLRPWMIHGHGNGWNDAPEISQFADSIVKDGPPLPKLHKPQIIPETQMVHTDYEGKGKFTEAWIYSTNSSGKWKNRKWNFIECSIQDKKLISKKKLPKDTSSFFVYVFRDRGGYRDNHAASDLITLGQ